MKKLIALTLAAMMMFALCACGGGTADGKRTDINEDDYEDNSGEGKLFEEKTVITLMVGSHPSWPYDPNWPMWKIMQEESGVTFSVNAVPTADFGTKIPLVFADDPEKFPDMIFAISGKSIADTYGPQGGLISISDNLDKMPNYKAFWEALDPEVRNQNMLLRMSGDGKIYFPPNYGIQTVGNTRTWMYRKDIFEKHNLKVPETMDEAYKVAKKLKTLYPDSYPFAIRSGFSNMNLMGPQWKEYFRLDTYYNFDEGEWHYGALEPEAKEMVEYFRKLVAEGLVPKNFLTISSTEWEELVNTDRGFMMLEYLLRIDHFNLPARQQNPEYTWAGMKPPKATADKGNHLIQNLSYELTGYMVCNSGDQKRIDSSLKFLDWMYSPEGIQVQSWGKEGVTYELDENGEKRWLVDEYGSPYGDLGMGTPGLYQCVEFAANEALYSEEQGGAGREFSPYQEELYNPASIIAFQSDLQDEAANISTEIRAYAEEMLSKFILSQLPMSKWDEFVQGLRDRNVDRLLELYTQQYDRINSKGDIW